MGGVAGESPASKKVREDRLRALLADASAGKHVWTRRRTSLPGLLPATTDRRPAPRPGIRLGVPARFGKRGSKDVGGVVLLVPARVSEEEEEVPHTPYRVLLLLQPTS
jgi:hypothetical protein